MSFVPNNFDTVENKGSISIQLASPDVIRSWSYGEVSKPETINYRSFKPERDGLFCEKIFGPVKNWECNCGKYKRIRYRGVVCDRCGVEVTHSKVRRERMGHIELAIPVVHIWFFKSLPSMIGSLLAVSMANLERVIYYESYLVLDPGDTELKIGDLISEDDYIDLEEEGRTFDAKMGGPAIKQLLANMDLDEMSEDLKSRLKTDKSVQKKADALKRLKIVEAIRKSENRPEWMVIDVLPVIPPDLRPLVPLEGGRFATSDLNDLYRRVINRNNRLKKLIDIKAPEVILRNEKRMLQESVDVLFDNGRRTSSVKGEGRRPLKSLSDLLKGKQGRFRQNLLGKRVDYSGRSVIVVGPELKMHECGIPKNMALELYKPFIIQKLEEEGYVHTVKSAKKFVEKERPEVWDILEEIIEDHPVLLNRAPTLHRLGIQAFYPKLIEGKAIRLHPLVCAAFNADFDGDQMAVHLPLSFETQLECRVIMLASNNILHPASGKPIAVPSQDIVLGLYYITKHRPGAKGEGRVFNSAEEAQLAYESGYVTLHTSIKVKFLEDTIIYSGHLDNETDVIDQHGDKLHVLAGGQVENCTLTKNEIFTTTVGRLNINKIIDPDMGYANILFDKKTISKSIDDLYRLKGNARTVRFLDDLKDLGFAWATKAGTSAAICDMIIPPEKHTMITDTQEKVDKIYDLYENGVITDGERYNQIVDAWSHTTNDVANLLFDRLASDDDGFNPVYMMADSGARGSREQIKQLSGMRGLMQKPTKKLGGQEVIENPIKSSFREGLNVMEYFISTHGARKGLADTALKTADAGYLTRRLVDVAQDVVINQHDCETAQGIIMRAIKDGDDVIEDLDERILGRILNDDLIHPVTEEVIVKAGEMIVEKHIPRIIETGIDEVMVRSVLTCEAKVGVCTQCYGRNLANGRLADQGQAVGVVAAQSIGEPGTQLTLRTFHIGGASSRLTIESSKKAPADTKVILERINVEEEIIYKGDDNIVVSRSGEMILEDEHGVVRGRYQIPYGSFLRVGQNELVKEGQVLFEWDPYHSMIIATKAGTVEFEELVKDKTMLVEYDDATGMENIRVMSDKKAKLRPHINVNNALGERVANFMMPEGAYLSIENGQEIKAGEILAKLPRAVGKTKDITGGLPRVAELFEARIPKAPAVIAPIDGIIEYGDIVRGQQVIFVREELDEEVKEKVTIPRGKHIFVHESERVHAGDKLCEGSINPHDILRVLGVNAVQEYLVHEIQAVYRLQGVAISDKHIECIVRQMMRKVKVKNSGDTNFLEQEDVSKAVLRIQNEKMIEQSLSPATFTPMLLGITKSSLGTDSFISAASFQETTKVLTRAAIEGKKDDLVGLKENVIMGRLIPSGTGSAHLKRVRVRDLDAETAAEEEPTIEDIQPMEIIEESPFRE
ncbi:MAG: DNA-directed RNA polymerase subunit beta' [Fibrobacterales bacterium]